jgi:phosphoribosylformimino-5-aminoimidazole carboxamide ribonucleotide (ProFAR) isomerase
VRILFSYPTEIDNESTIINELVTSGNWDLIHLRKPGWSRVEIERLFQKLSVEAQTKTVFHTSGKQSCHTFNKVDALEGKEAYCFLSPIFDSISKEGYKANFEKEALKQFLQKERQIKVIALGGVTAQNYNEIIEMGFDGGAFLGSIWSKYE